MGYSVMVRREKVVRLPKSMTLAVLDEEKESLITEMGRTAKEINQLRLMIKNADGSKDHTIHDRIALKLDAAEKCYFLLFNQYRVNEGYTSLLGDKFTGSEHRYESYLY